MPAICLALLLALLVGCGTTGGGGGNSGSVQEIHLFGLPTALTMAGSSVAGGVGVRIYASTSGGSKGLPLRQGTLEILLFDQSPTGLDAQTAKPLKIWSFAANELVPYQSNSLMGFGYQFELQWDKDRPRGRVFTIVARFRPNPKTEIYSTPAAIAIATH